MSAVDQAASEGDREVPRVAIVGTGNVGGALGTRLAGLGVPTTFLVREGADADALLERAGPHARSAPADGGGGEADVLFLAVPAPAAVSAAQAARPRSGTVIVDCTNPVRWAAGPVWDPPEAGSVAAAIAAALPACPVVKAFNVFGAEWHAEPSSSSGPVTVPMAGDDEGAKAIVRDLATRSGFHPVDAGPLRNAALLENQAILWIHLATVGGLGREVAFRLVPRE